MASVCEGSSRESFVEQIFSSLITLTLHLNDPVDQVRESCKTCFKSVAPLLEQADLIQLVDEALPLKKSINYSDFISDYSKILVENYPFKVNFFIMNSIVFFKNPVPELRTNAAIVAGYIISHLNEQQINNLSKEHILNGKFDFCRTNETVLLVVLAFLILLKDPVPQVRCRVAEAMHFMYKF